MEVPERIQRMIEKKEHHRKEANRYARLINTAMRKIRRERHEPKDS